MFIIILLNHRSHFGSRLSRCPEITLPAHQVITREYAFGNRTVWHIARNFKMSDTASTWGTGSEDEPEQYFKVHRKTLETLRRLQNGSWSSVANLADRLNIPQSEKPHYRAKVRDPNELIEVAEYVHYTLLNIINKLLPDQMAVLQQNHKRDSDDEENDSDDEEEKNDHGEKEEDDPEEKSDSDDKEYEPVERDPRAEEDYKLVERDLEDKKEYDPKEESDPENDNYEEQPLRMKDLHRMIPHILKNTQKQLDARMGPVVKELGELKKKHTLLENYVERLEKDYVKYLEQIIDSQKHDTNKCQVFYCQLLEMFEGMNFKNNNRRNHRD